MLFTNTVYNSPLFSYFYILSTLDISPLHTFRLNKLLICLSNLTSYEPHHILNLQSNLLLKYRDDELPIGRHQLYTNF